jgi:glycosyltransferase involved in cell wall biosynthesis
MPPAPTGIASYSAAILPALRELLDRPIRTMWPLDRIHEGQVAEHALAVYHLGNNVAFHRDIYRHAMATPGLVVLHDLGLDDFVRGLVAHGDALGYRAAREAMRLAPRFRMEDGALDDGPLAVPWVADVVRHARGVVVHAPFGRRYLDALGNRTPVYVVPHPLPEAEEAVARAATERWELRTPLEAAGMRTLVGVFGDLNEAKLVDAVIAAVAQLDPSFHLVLVGRRIPSFDVEALAAVSGLGDRVRIHHDVSDEAFLAWMSASDVVVDLRHPHRGEVSGALARAMQVGRPTIVSATGTYLDVAADLVRHVPPGRVDPEVLASAIVELAAPSVGGAMGERAARAIRAEADAAPRAYAEAIVATLGLVADPGRRALARWARALTDLGATEDDLASGIGARYAAALDELERAPRPPETPPLD